MRFVFVLSILVSFAFGEESIPWENPSVLGVTEGDASASVKAELIGNKCKI